MRVRRAVPGDEAAIRALRLRAMTGAPEAFTSTYERELARTDDDWRRWIEPGPTFLLESADGAAVGLVCGQLDPDDPDAAWLLAMWVDPPGRGTGGADALVQAVVTWATTAGRTAVHLHYTEGNEPARRLYERNGFDPNGHTFVNERGDLEIEMARRTA